MFDFIKEVAALMVRPDLTIEDTIAQLGELKVDQGPSLIVHPNNPAFSEVTIVKQVESSEPSYVRLLASESIELTAFADVFGDYRVPPRLGRGKEKRIIFGDIADSDSHVASLTVTSGKDEMVSAIVIQRNTHLD